MGMTTSTSTTECLYLYAGSRLMESENKSENDRRLTTLHFNPRLPTCRRANSEERFFLHLRGFLLVLAFSLALEFRRESRCLYLSSLFLFLPLFYRLFA